MYIQEKHKKPFCSMLKKKAVCKEERDQFLKSWKIYVKRCRGDYYFLVKNQTERLWCQNWKVLFEWQFHMSELKSIIRMTIPHVRTEKYYSTDNSECQNWKVLFDWQFHIYNEPDRQLAMHVKTEGIYFKLERKLNIFFSSKYHA